MVFKKRAVQDTQKAERREVILDKAAKLLMKKDFHSITVAEIAKEAGIAKGTVFLYFKTKEEIFLQLQMRYYDLWFKDIDARLEGAASKKDFGISDLVDIALGTLKIQPLLFRLIPILHVIIEQNIDNAKALEFKRFMHIKLSHTAGIIEERLPFLKGGWGAAVLLNVQALIIGTLHLTESPAVMKKLIKDNNLDMFNLEFEKVFRTSLTNIITGMKYAHLEK